MVSRAVIVGWLALGTFLLVLPSVALARGNRAHARGDKRVVAFVPTATGKLVRTTIPARLVKVVRPRPKPVWPFVGADLPKSLPHGIGEVGDLPVWVHTTHRGRGRTIVSEPKPKPKPVWPFVGADLPLSLPDGTGEAGKLPKWVGRPKPKPVLPFKGADRPLSLPHGLGPAGDLPVWVGTVR